MNPPAGLRVLFVNRMASLERGGGETFDLEISRHLERLGCAVTYLTGLPLFTGARTPLNHPRAFTVRTPYFGWVPWDVMKGGWRLRVLDVDLFSRAAARWAARREGEFDVIQVCELPEFVRVWKDAGRRTPVVIRLTAPNFHDPARAIRRADAVIASGTSVGKLQASGELSGVINVPNAVDTERFRPQPTDFRARQGIAADALVLLYVARFQAFKNHEMLIRAFARVAASVPESVLVLAGSGPLRERVLQQAAGLGVADRVRCLGEVAFGDLPQVYAAADIKVISSDYESFCFAALEGMSSGLPVVTTDCGWVPNLLGGAMADPPAAPARVLAGGLVTPVGAAEALADAVLALHGQPALRRRMGEFNRAKAVAEHGWPSSARKLLEIHQTILASVKGVAGR